MAKVTQKIIVLTLFHVSFSSAVFSQECGVTKWLELMADRSNIESHEVWYLPKDGRDSTLRLLDVLGDHRESDQHGVRQAIKEIVHAMGKSDFLDLRIHIQLGWFLNARSSLQYRDKIIKHNQTVIDLNSIFAEFQAKRWLDDPVLLERYCHLLVWSGVVDKMTLEFLQCVPNDLAKIDSPWRKDDRRYWPCVRGYLVSACLTNRHLEVDDKNIELSFRKWWLTFNKAVTTTGKIRASHLSPTWILDSRRKALTYPKLIVRPTTPYPGQTESLSFEKLTPKVLLYYMHEF